MHKYPPNQSYVGPSQHSQNMFPRPYVTGKLVTNCGCTTFGARFNYICRIKFTSRILQIRMAPDSIAFSRTAYVRQCTQIFGRPPFPAGSSKPCEPHLTKDLGPALGMARAMETETAPVKEPQLDLEANPMQRTPGAGTAHRRTARTDHCIHRTDTSLQPRPDPTGGGRGHCNGTPRSFKIGVIAC